MISEEVRDSFCSKRCREFYRERAKKARMVEIINAISIFLFFYILFGIVIILAHTS